MNSIISSIVTAPYTLGHGITSYSNEFIKATKIVGTPSIKESRNVQRHLKKKHNNNNNNNNYSNTYITTTTIITMNALKCVTLAATYMIHS